MIHKVWIFCFQHGFQRRTFCLRRPFRLNLPGRTQLHHQLCRQKFLARTTVPAGRRHFGSFFLSLPCRIQKTACPQPLCFVTFCGKGNPFCSIIRLNRIAQNPSLLPHMPKHICTFSIAQRAMNYHFFLFSKFIIPFRIRPALPLKFQQYHQKQYCTHLPGSAHRHKALFF